MASITVFADGATAVNDATVGTLDWSNLSNVGADDSADAFMPSATVGTSKYLRVAPNSLAAIPSGATIDGIEIVVQRYETQAANNVTDSSLRLYKSGTGFVGDNKASGTEWTTSPANFTYGGTSDLWGTTWTRDEVVNDLEFGISAAYAGAGAGSGRIDVISFKIYYTSSTAWQATVNESSVFGGSSTLIGVWQGIVSEASIFGGAGTLNADLLASVNETSIFGGSGVLNTEWTAEVAETSVFGGIGLLGQRYTSSINEVSIFGGSGLLSLAYLASINEVSIFGGLVELGVGYAAVINEASIFGGSALLTALWEIVTPNSATDFTLVSTNTDTDFVLVSVNTDSDFTLVT